jgi:hypothetical protein
VDRKNQNPVWTKGAFTDVNHPDFHFVVAPLLRWARSVYAAQDSLLGESSGVRPGDDVRLILPAVQAQLALELIRQPARR